MSAITCPTDCAGVLPAVSFSDCNPEINASEINKIFIAKGTAAAFTNWATATEWNTRLAATTGADVIKELVVSAEKPAPAAQEREISNFRKSVVRKNHLINFTIDESNATNHELVRNLECGGTFKVWYQTTSGHIFGGNDGITANIKLDMILPKGENEIIRYDGTIEWKSKFTEERVVSPIA